MSKPYRLYKEGDRVEVLSGEHKGRVGTVLGPKIAVDRLRHLGHSPLGYRVEFDNGDLAEYVAGELGKDAE